VGTTVTATLPPTIPWIQNIQNGCTLDDLPAYWKEYDTLTFLGDLGRYHSSLIQVLDAREKEQAQAFRTDYFKKRFIFSRSIIKYILHHMLETDTIEGITLLKDTSKRIVVKNRHDIYLSLSYSGTSVALSVGKQKTGSDIEVVYPMDIRKINSSPVFDDAHLMNEKERIPHFFQVWTMVEAYAKLRDRNPFSLLNNRCLFEDAHFISYCIDNRSILSLAFDADSIKDTLLWIDPGCMHHFSPDEKKPVGLPSVAIGDTYVRA
jgi:4'-phosphopantetheinyl transferase